MPSASSAPRPIPTPPPPASARPAASPGHTFAAPPAIDLGDLIGRTPRPLDRARVAAVLTGRRVLITGAGGSIGSHLAHVAAEFDPRQIILMERAENSLFEIDRQLARRFPSVPRRAVLHDVVDRDETARLLADARPDVVFHAAAHKHVPLMEDHPAHAVVNNLFGTAAVADAARDAGAERFVMISSDKAVNPSSVMGATKRLAEMYISHLARADAPARTRWSMVRFGNVLGSVGSVLTIWSSQIAEGGPVTLTDPRMTRYFMTIPEAAGLVIASSTLDEQPSGAVYVLDMGEPIRVVDLAERFVRAHGYEPRVTSGVRPDHAPPARAMEPSLLSLVEEAIGGAGTTRRVGATARPIMPIVITGSRAGEKLHEELAYAAESLRPTSHAGINCWSGPSSAQADHPPLPQIPAMLAEFGAACARRDHAAVLRTLRRYVPTMTPREL